MWHVLKNTLVENYLEELVAGVGEAMLLDHKELFIVSYLC
jgi:hypothetical protein